MPIRLRGLLHRPQPEIDIHINNAERTFRALDRLDGVVRITVPVDTGFSDVDIQFVGTTMSYVEGFTSAVNISGKRGAFHTFLKLSQPGQHLFYPGDRVLRSGKLYDFPFVFVVPRQLLPQMCQHRVSDPAVRRAHMQLPPSLGDKDLGRLQGLPDDLAPANASVRYGVFCRLLGNESHACPSTTSHLAANAKRVRVIPTFDEQAPGVSCDPGEYVFRKEYRVKTGLLQGACGTLVAEADKPTLLLLPFPKTELERRASILVMIKLRFNPEDEHVAPPRIRHIVATLESATYFTSTAYHNFPSKGGLRNDMNQGMHSVTRALSRHSIGHVEWSRQIASSEGALGYHGPASRSHDTFESRQGANSRLHFVAEVPVPIVFPSDQTFVPSFHSCFLSRTYSLGLKLSVVGAGITSNTLELNVPIQVGVDGGKGCQPLALPTYEGSNMSFGAGSGSTLFPSDSSSGVGNDDHRSFGSDLYDPPCYAR